MNRLSGIVLLVVFFASSVQATNLIKGERLQYLSANEMKQVWDANHIPQLFLPINNGVSIYEISYYTPWYNGTSVKASGYIFVPDALIESPSVLLYHHGTRILKKGNTTVEANEFGLCAGFAADGYVVVMPEYIGLGNGDGHQLYLHAQTEASASVDMLRAANDFMQRNFNTTLHNIFITGYSQGGHAALATHASIEKNYSNEFHVVASAPMSGPYDMSGVLPLSFHVAYDSPALFAFMLQSYHEIYGLGASLSDIFRAPYDSLVPLYLDGVNNYRILNKTLPQLAQEVVTPQFFQQQMLQPQSAFMQALAANDVYKFIPQAPTQFCYCSDDETVDPRNSSSAYQWMRSQGVKKVYIKDGGENLDHVDCAIFALMHTKLFFDKYRYPLASNFKNDASNVSLRLIIMAKDLFPGLKLGF